MDKKVAIIVIGSRKCATTSLADLLEAHPEISMSSPKEPNYFCNSQNELAAKLDDYLACFDWSKKFQAEASTAYTTYPKSPRYVAKNIHDHNPDTKIIYLIRKPIDRIVSNFVFSYDNGYIRDPLDKVVSGHRYLLDFCKYYEQLTPYIELFPKEQILVIQLEDFSGHQASVLKRLEKFIGLESPFTTDSKPMHSNSKDTHRVPIGFRKYLTSAPVTLLRKVVPKSMIKAGKAFLHKQNSYDGTLQFSEDDCQFIDQYLEADLKQLEQYLDVNLSHWRIAQSGNEPGN